MQAEANILERAAQVYVAHRWARPLCVLGVLGAALLLFLLSGGFPPFAWRLLAQALPQISVLEAMHGQAALLALFGLILLSFTLLLAWGALLWLLWRMLAYWRYERRELRDFASDAMEAQYLAADEEAAYATQYAEALDKNGLYQDELDDGYLEDEEDEDTLEFFQEEEEDEDKWDEIAPGSWQERAGEADEWGEVVPGARRGGAGGKLTALHAGEEAGKLHSWDRMPRQITRSQSLPPTNPVCRAASLPPAPASSQPGRAVGMGGENTIVSAIAPAYQPAYDQQIVEHAGPGERLDNINHSSYGRIVPFAPISAVDAHSRPSANLYGRVPLPGAVTATPEPATRRLTTQLIVSTGLDVGLKRKDKPNEDSLLALQNTRVLRGCSCPVGLFVVADGMGGHSNGQEASRLVIQSLSKTVVPSIIYGPTDDNYAELLAEGVHHANLEVYQRNRQEKVNMGTTIAAALVVDTTAYVVSAGDSRVYLYRASSGLSQVTRDHSTVARLVETGLIQPDEIYTHPRRNEIYRSLGHHPSEDLDKFILALQPEDLLLLCSDGLWEMVRDFQIQQVIAATLHQPTRISAALVQAALEGGGKDNISVIVVYVKAVEAAQAAWAG